MVRATRTKETRISGEFIFPPILIPWHYKIYLTAQYLLQQMMGHHLLLLLLHRPLLLLLLHCDVGRAPNHILIAAVHLLLAWTGALCRWLVSAEHLFPARRHELIGQAVLQAVDITS